MKLTILGTGAADVIERYNASFFVHDNKTKGMLIDAGGGNGILLQLTKSNIPLEAIERIFITHPHIDHLLGIFWILRFLGSKIAASKADPITIYAPKKTRDIIEKMSLLLLKEKVTGLFGKKILFHELIDGERISLPQGTLIPFDARGEKSEMFGFRYELENKGSLVMLGDEPYKPELQKYCKNADLLIHNAYCSEEKKDYFKPSSMHHSTVKEASEYATLLQAKKLLLIHFGEQIEPQLRDELYTTEAKRYFNGVVIVPDDLAVIEI